MGQLTDAVHSANDTGYMRMKEVRIPREHMFAKGAIVTPDGKYYKTAAKKENPVFVYIPHSVGVRALTN